MLLSVRLIWYDWPFSADDEYSSQRLAEQHSHWESISQRTSQSRDNQRVNFKNQLWRLVSEKSNRRISQRDNQMINYDDQLEEANRAWSNWRGNCKVQPVREFNEESIEGKIKETMRIIRASVRETTRESINQLKRVSIKSESQLARRLAKWQAIREIFRASIRAWTTNWRVNRRDDQLKSSLEWDISTEVIE